DFQHLTSLPLQQHDHTTVSELFDQRFGQRRRCRSDQDAIKRRLHRPALIAIATLERDVVDLQITQSLSRTFGKASDTFNAEYMTHQTRQHCALIAAACADLEHFRLLSHARELQLSHACHDISLRERPY